MWWTCSLLPVTDVFVLRDFFHLFSLCSYGLCSGRDLADHREIGVVSPPPLDIRCSTDGMLCSFCWHCELA